MLKLFNRNSDKDSPDSFATSSSYQHKRQGSLRNMNYFKGDSVDFASPPSIKNKDRTTTNSLVTHTVYSATFKQQYGGLADSKKYISCENVSRLTEDSFLKSIIGEDLIEHGIKDKLAKPYNLLMKSFRKAKIKKRRDSVLRLDTNYEEESNNCCDSAQSVEQNRTLQLKLSDFKSESSPSPLQQRKNNLNSQQVTIINNYAQHVNGRKNENVPIDSNEKVNNDDEDNDDNEDENNDGAVPVFIGVKLISNEFVDLKPNKNESKMSSLQSINQNTLSRIPTQNSTKRETPSSTQAKLENSNNENMLRLNQNSAPQINQKIVPARSPPPPPTQATRKPTTAQEISKKYEEMRKNIEKIDTKLENTTKAETDSNIKIKACENNINNLINSIKSSSSSNGPKSSPKQPTAMQLSIPELNQTILNGIDESAVVKNAIKKENIKHISSKLKPQAPKIPKNIAKTNSDSISSDSISSIKRSKTFTEQIKEKLEKKTSPEFSAAQTGASLAATTTEREENENHQRFLTNPYSSLEPYYLNINENENEKATYGDDAKLLSSFYSMRNTSGVSDKDGDYPRQLKLLSSELSSNLHIKIENHANPVETPTLNPIQLEKFSLSSSISSSCSSASKFFNFSNKNSRKCSTVVDNSSDDNDFNDLVKVLGRQPNNFKEKFFDCLITQIWDAKLPYSEYVQLNKLMKALFGENYHKFATNSPSQSCENKLNAEHIVNLMRGYLDSNCGGMHSLNARDNNNLNTSVIYSSSNQLIDDLDNQFLSMANLIDTLKRQQQKEEKLWGVSSVEQSLLNKYMSVPMENSNRLQTNLKLDIEQPQSQPPPSTDHEASKIKHLLDFLNSKNEVEETENNQITFIRSSDLRNALNSDLNSSSNSICSNIIENKNKCGNSTLYYAYDQVKKSKIISTTREQQSNEVSQSGMSELYSTSTNLVKNVNSLGIPANVRVINATFQLQEQNQQRFLNNPSPANQVYKSNQVVIAGPPKPKLISKLVKTGGNKSIEPRSAYLRDVKEIFRNEDETSSNLAAESNYIDFSQLRKIELAKPVSTEIPIRNENKQINTTATQKDKVIDHKSQTLERQTINSKTLKPMNLKTIVNHQHTLLNQPIKSMKTSIQLSPSPIQQPPQLMAQPIYNNQRIYMETNKMPPVYGNGVYNSIVLPKNKVNNETNNTVYRTSNAYTNPVNSDNKGQHHANQTVQYATLTRYTQIKEMLANKGGSVARNYMPHNKLVKPTLQNVFINNKNSNQD